MGVLDAILGGATGGGGGGLLGGILGPVAPLAGAAIGIATSPIALAGGVAGSVLADPIGTVLGVAGIGPAIAGITGVDLTGGRGQVDTTGFGGGNGRTATRTIVQTMDLTTGEIIRQKTMPGSPRLMNSDVAAARKVIKGVGKLHSQMPRRTVKEGPTTKLKNAAVDAAIARATCPPEKCS